jgi:glycosyltransferase involved in cell wall biosynthesis
MNTHTVFLVRQLNYGGAQRQLVTLVKGLAARGHQVTVMSFYGEGKLDSELVAQGIPIVYLNKQGRWDNLGFLGRMVQALRRLHPSVIHGYLGIPNLFTILLKPFFLGTRMVWGVRESMPTEHGRSVLVNVIHHAECWTSRWADLIILNSHAGKANHQTIGYPDRKMVVIPNGIDTDRFVPNRDSRRDRRHAWQLTDQHCVIGCVGRLHPVKDHTTFLNAAAILHRQYPQLRFVCVGSVDGEHDQAYVRSLQDLAISLGLETVLQWREATHDIEAVYNAIDLLVLTSSGGEGFPNVLGEAMACGTACVSTAVGDSEFVMGPWGTAVPPKDAVAIAQAVERQLQQIPMQHAQRRQYIVENFSVATLVEKTAATLDHLTQTPVNVDRIQPNPINSH